MSEKPDEKDDDIDTDVIENDDGIDGKVDDTDGDGGKPDDEPKDDSTPDEIERAARMGHVPRDKFRGDPSKWVSAKEFIRRGENELPILRERLRKADDGLKELAEVKETLKSFQGYMSKSEERAYNRLKKEVEGKVAQAREVGDFDAYEAAQKELQELERDAKPKPPPSDDSNKGKDAPDPAKDPVYGPWLQENPWMNTDATMAAYAEAHGTFLARTQPELKGRAYLDAVTKAVKKEFSDKFENPRRSGAPRVEGNNGGAQRKSGGGKTYNDLPADAKKECDRFVRDIPGFTKEQFVKDYDWS